MNDETIPQTEDRLLNKLRSSEDPVKYLSCLFDVASHKEDIKLRQLLKSLSNQGFIHIPMWADNKPYCIEVFDLDVVSGHRHAELTINDSHDIIIGDNPIIYGSSIGGKQEESPDGIKSISQSFFEKHPVVCSIAISLIVGFLFLFSFWKGIVNFIEGLF